MTIYNLMNRIHTLRFSVLTAMRQYKEGLSYYWTWEDEAKASFNTLCECGFLDEYDTFELLDQLYHVMRLYKRRS